MAPALSERHDLGLELYAGAVIPGLVSLRVCLGVLLGCPMILLLYPADWAVAERRLPKAASSWLGSSGADAARLSKLAHAAGSDMLLMYRCTVARSLLGTICLIRSL